MLHKWIRCLNKHETRLFVPGICLLIVLGCSKNAGRQGLEGTVTFDGAPLAEGYITFFPQTGTKGPIAGGDITNGRFYISPAGGTFCGTFRVEITAVRKTGKKVMDHFRGSMIDETEQFIPERYNTKSELNVEVNEDGQNQFTFILKSGIAS